MWVINITIIIKVSQVQFKIYKYDNLDYIIMSLIRHRLKTVYIGNFHGWTLAGETQLLFLSQGEIIPSTEAKITFNFVIICVFVTIDLKFYSIVLGRELILP